MTIEWLAGNRLRGTTAERPVGILASPSVGGWVEVGRTTLGSAGDDITVSSLADKRYYMFLTSALNSGDNSLFLQMGNGSVDTGSNYAQRFSNDGAADGSGVNQTKIFCGDNNTSPKFNVGYIANLSAKEKLYQGWEVMQNTAGAGTAPRRMESTGKWANTSNPLDTINFNNTMGGSYDTGSEMVVLGWDPTDTHTTNFWEELASVDQTTGANTLSSGVFTSKKYLWIQCYLDTNDGHDPVFRVGNTTVDTSNYAFRRNYNGGSDTTHTSQASIVIGNTLTNCFHNIFIINNSANEKLIIYNGNSVSTAGAGTQPERTEVVGKWANTSSQIDIVDFYKSGASYKGNLRVWGSD
ncbi:hypothetical protein OAU96_02415 [Planctomycetota bacterium]|nr:hypothetical protein [Planctomycetota bacterium]